MCGIAGKIGRERPPSDEVLANMLGALAHRGPDGEGRFSEGCVALGMTRLSIVGLTTGWQPLFSEDRSVVVVCNGEIYNYLELRQELVLKGHQFNTESDCEAIVHLYEEFDLDFVRKLRGMFALAIWDSRKKRLIVARDRMGEKPLYFVEREGSFIFASEMKSILASGDVEPALDPQAIAEFFHFGFVNDPLTPFRDVRKLSPAEMMIVDTNPWCVQKKTYWDPFAAEPIYDDPKMALIGSLDEVSGLVVRADVPVGVALSGGIDSSLVACLAGNHLGEELTAISAGYRDAPHEDESHVAHWLAKKKGWKFVRTEISDDDAVLSFEDMVVGCDDPIADISGIGYSRVNEAAKAHGIKTMLFGNGGDEFFWGYRWVRAAAIVNRSLSGLGQDKNLPIFAVLRPAGAAPLDLARWILKEGMGLALYRRMLRARRRTSTVGASALYALDDAFLDLFDNPLNLFTRSFSERINRDKLFSFRGSRLGELGGDLETIRLISASYLLQNGLVQGDRLSMRSSVEARSPLLDYRFIETVVGLKKAQPDLHLPAKSLLRVASRDLVPGEVFDRPKRGFSPPARRWYAAIAHAYGDRLVNGRLVSLGILRQDVAEELARGKSRFVGSNPMHFKALVFELWIKMAEEILGQKVFIKGGASLL